MEEKNKKLISLDHVSYEYPDARANTSALKDVSLFFPKESFTAIVGPSGGGKSTLLRIIAGAIKPNQGEVNLTESISMVFQGGALLPWRTVYDNVHLAFESKNRKDAKHHASIMEMLSLLSIEHLKDSYPRALSGGQKQRVGIARALVISPEVLLLDEPFSALDADTTLALQNELLEIWNKKKMTIIMVSHSIESAIYLADRIIVIKDGKVAHESEIKLPRPRVEGSDEILNIAHKIRRMI